MNEGGIGGLSWMQYIPTIYCRIDAYVGTGIGL